METGTDKVASKHLATLAQLLGTLLLFSAVISIYVVSGRRISVGHLELARRGGTQWGYQKVKAVAFSSSGRTLHTGDSYCLGPFRVTHWRDWSVVE
jgi:hypothetical protein